MINMTNGEPLESAYESLDKLDKALVSAAKNATTLSRGISKVYSLQAGKKWEIFSRFISGSGLWKVQNKLRAIVQVMHQFTDAGNKAAEASAKQLTQLTELSESHKSLQEAQKLFAPVMEKGFKAELLKRKEIREMIDDQQMSEAAAIEQYKRNSSKKYAALSDLTDVETARLQIINEVNAQEEKAEMRKALAKEKKAEDKKARTKELRENWKIKKAEYKMYSDSLKKHTQEKLKAVESLSRKQNQLDLMELNGIDKKSEEYQKMHKRILRQKGEIQNSEALLS